jgi:N-methylhydantoinase A
MYPARTQLRGPAAGLAGAARVANDLGLSQCVTFDMGGTSFDVGVIENGQPVAAKEWELEYNVPIGVPMLDIRSIGAGGGSIAYLDRGGMLRVGPQSAGSEPGPIWYGRGGRNFTVTDANVLAGRIHANTLGSDLRPTINRDAIWAATSENQGDLSLAHAFHDPSTLADAVLRVVNAHMAACVREITVRRGRDPGEFALLAFGGAGPLHAVDIARELGAKRVVIPSSPGLLSAYGCLTADLVVDSLAPARLKVTDLDREALAGLVSDRAQAVRRTLNSYTSAPVETRVFYECQFQHQGHSIEVEGSLGLNGEQIGTRFLATYAETYGHLVPDAEILIRRVRVEGRCRRYAHDGVRLDEVASPASRPVNGSQNAYWRPDLPPDAIIKGPATIASQDASIYIPPDAVATVVDHGHIVVDP